LQAALRSTNSTTDDEADETLLWEMARHLARADKWCALLTTFAAKRTPIALEYAVGRADALLDHVELLARALSQPCDRELRERMRRLRVEVGASRLWLDG
jgi:hypothetical protein